MQTLETCEGATSWIRGVDQQKQLLHSQSEISRDSEYDEPEFKETIKNARKKLETSVAPAMPL